MQILPPKNNHDRSLKVFWLEQIEDQIMLYHDANRTPFLRSSVVNGLALVAEMRRKGYTFVPFPAAQPQPAVSYS
jgi:hypothetical protein